MRPICESDCAAIGCCLGGHRRNREKVENAGEPTRGGAPAIWDDQRRKGLFCAIRNKAREALQADQHRPHAAMEGLSSWVARVCQAAAKPPKLRILDRQRWH